MNRLSAFRQRYGAVAMLDRFLALRNNPPPPQDVVLFAGYCFSAYCLSQLICRNVVDVIWTQGASMHPSLPSDLSCAVVSRRHAYGKGCKIGDIVQFDNPVFLGGGACKRIIGMPGDYVIHDPPMSASSGGAPVPGIVEDDGDRQEPHMIQVPEGHVWLIGDNMSWSRDSRFFGPVPMALISGKYLMSIEGLFRWRWQAKDHMVGVMIEAEQD